MGSLEKKKLVRLLRWRDILERQIIETSNIINQVITEYMTEKHPNVKEPTICFKGWDCEESPFNICVYDDSTDLYWTKCVFCGYPFERK